MRLRGVPVFVACIAALAAAMLGPALFASVEGDWRSARMFAFSAVFVGFLAAILGVASRGNARPGPPARAELMTLLGVFAGGPAFAAAPIALLAPELGAFGAWFEAAASLTTTGATLIDPPEAAPRALHLWRAVLGWIGGFATLVAAAAVLAPRELLDLPGQAPISADSVAAGRALALGPGGARAARAAAAIGPIYLGFTAAATAALASGGGSSFAAFCHAMGLVSTSGITPVTGGLAGQGSRLAEAAAVVCLLFAATRLTYAGRMARVAGATLGERGARRLDPELRLLLIAVAAATAAVLAGGSAGYQAGDAPLTTEGGLARAAWGAAVTALSFATTTGYVSADWAHALAWSGAREPPAMLLIGLATLGGGVATTAGGVKLFRAYALFRHSGAELARLPHPDMVDQTRTAGGRIARRAIVNAWVVLMLYLGALVAGMVALTLAGLSVDAALAAAAAALSNAGPLLPHAAGLSWAELPTPALAIAGAAMVLGRIELLAAVALCNPGYWRR